MFGIDFYSIDWKGLAFSITYLLVLSGSLASFSSIYRRRKTARSASLAPWFGKHLSRDIYLSLLHTNAEPDASADKQKQASGQKIPESALRAALLRRAVEDIHRLIQIRTAKQAITSMLARGNIGDDLWQRFQRAEKEMEAELRDVVMEANAFTPGWGNSIFQTAHEMANNLSFRKRLNEILSHTESEREWWEKRREKIQSEFLKELEAGGGRACEGDGGDSASAVPDGKPQKGKK